MVVFYHFRSHFSGAEYYKVKANQMKEMAEQSHLKELNAKYQLLELRQYVSAVLQKELKYQKSNEANYQRRSLASIVAPQENQSLLTFQSKDWFVKAKVAFKDKNFSRAIHYFNVLIDRFPFSPHVVESHFLIVESYFLLNKSVEVIQATHQMMSHFPEHELTAYALLKVGKIYEEEGRMDDAFDLYKLIAKSYKGSKVSSVAEHNKRMLQ